MTDVRIPIHTSDPYLMDAADSVTLCDVRLRAIEERLARQDERIMALEEQQLRCQALDEEMWRAAEPRGGLVDGGGRSYRVAKRVPLADPDLSDLR